MQLAHVLANRSTFSSKSNEKCSLEGSAQPTPFDPNIQNTVNLTTAVVHVHETTVSPRQRAMPLEEPSSFECMTPPR
jgi:hypothetical protein